jgi:hypothetical protein
MEARGLEYVRADNSQLRGVEIRELLGAPRERYHGMAPFEGLHNELTAGLPGRSEHSDTHGDFLGENAE